MKRISINQNHTVGVYSCGDSIITLINFQNLTWYSTINLLGIFFPQINLFQSVTYRPPNLGIKNNINYGEKFGLQFDEDSTIKKAVWFRKKKIRNLEYQKI